MSLPRVRYLLFLGANATSSFPSLCHYCTQNLTLQKWEKRVSVTVRSAVAIVAAILVGNRPLFRGATENLRIEVQDALGGMVADEVSESNIRVQHAVFS